MPDMNALQAVVTGMAVGETAELPIRGGWRLRITKLNTGDEVDIRVFNPVGDTGQERFFAYDTIGDKYGAGKIVQEPSLGIALGDCGVDVADRLVGAIVLDETGKVKIGADGKPCRFSWSNVTFAKHQKMSVTSTGELEIDGVSYGYLAAVFLTDKNRMNGYVGVFTPTKPDKVRVAEMEELAIYFANAGM